MTHSCSNLEVPNDMCDFHEGIIDGDTEVVNRHPVASHNDEVSHCVRIPGNIAANAVPYRHTLILEKQLLQ